MSRAELCASLLVAGMAVYAVLGGADFGAGFWDLTAGGARRGARLRALVARSMSPVWEANHVWLILVMVLVWAAFPRFAGLVGSSLYVPLFVAALGIILRGAAFALRGQAATIAQQRALGGLFAISSVVVPFFLGAAVGAIAGGRVPASQAAADPMEIWLNPMSLLVGTLAVAVGTHIAAVFLTADAARSELQDLVAACRRRALWSGAVAGGLAVAGLLLARTEAPRLYHGLGQRWGLAFVVLSAVAGITALVALVRRRLRLARGAVVGAVGAMVVGGALALQGDLLPGQLSVAQAAAGDSTLTALLVSFAIGMALVLPSLAYLYRLVLRGQLDHDSGVLGQRATTPPTRTRRERVL